MKSDAGEVTLVFIAGVGNSGEGHWQRLWAAAFGKTSWLEHSDWDSPNRDVWTSEMANGLKSVSGPKLLICHSLGCLLVSEWSTSHADPDVVGAFLVAVPDPTSSNFPSDARGFNPPRSTRLPFPSLVVASANDPFSTVSFSEQTAAAWGAGFENIGEKGHINAESGLGMWDEGLALLRNYFGARSIKI